MGTLDWGPVVRSSGYCAELLNFDPQLQNWQQLSECDEKNPVDTAAANKRTAATSPTAHATSRRLHNNSMEVTSTVPSLGFKQTPVEPSSSR